MLVQSKLRSTCVFLLRVSPKTLLLPFCLLPVKNVRHFHLGKNHPIILIVPERTKEIQNFGIFGLFCDKNIFYITKILFLSQKICQIE